MIYEIRTYQLRPHGAVGEYLKRFTAAYEAGRDQRSQIAGCFTTEIGPLNQVVTIWPYESEAERERIRRESGGVDGWPPKLDDLAQSMVSEIFVPMNFAPTIPAGSFGPVYEMRSYQLKPDSKPIFEENWGRVIEERRKMSPLVAALFSVSGTLNKFVHIWGYESLNHRAEIRAAATRTPHWPPPAMPHGTLISQENKILVPTPFSPLR